MPMPISFLGRQARVIVSPKPVTLFETCAILKTLQSFGPVSHFFNARYVPALRSQSHLRFHVTFDEKESFDKALAATPFTVELGHDAIDPEEADPFNVRGFWDRKRVERKTFRCAVVDNATTQRSASTWNRQVLQGNPYHGPFRVDRLAVSFEDLMRQGAPSPAIADCFQKRYLSEADRAGFEQEAQRWSFYATADNGEITGGLMDTWRESLKPDITIGQVEVERGKLGT